MIPLRDRLPRKRVPIVNYLLLTANVLVFVWERMTIALGVHPTRLLLEWGVVPPFVLEAPLARWPTLFSSMFLHDPTGWAHIAGNMLFLWIFGDNVEDALGRFRYLAFYLLSGLAAATAQILIDPSSTVPMVGASGAIAGVLAAYGSLYPRSPITVLNPILPLWFVFGLFLEIPAWLVILEFFVVNLLNGLGVLGDLRGQGGGVAFFAHLGGFVAGLFLVRLLVQDKVNRYDRWSGWRAPPRARSGRANYAWSAQERRRDPWGW